MSRLKVRKKDKDNTKQAEDAKRQKVELKGPRVKHVCRSASIVLGQPLATFPTQDEKERQEKNMQTDDEIALSIVEKDRDTPELSSCESELDLENKAPTISDNVVSKDVDMQVETKRRKLDQLIPVKIQNKAESSEDEIVMDLVPRKTVMKPLSNITNVSTSFLKLFKSKFSFSFLNCVLKSEFSVLEEFTNTYLNTHKEDPNSDFFLSQSDVSQLKVAF